MHGLRHFSAYGSFSPTTQIMKPEHVYERFMLYIQEKFHTDLVPTGFEIKFSWWMASTSPLSQPVPDFR